ncbi:BQ5605_C006g04040 [Microbotryum silenes-dioicae]|uniref:BQ5605_C006g04040 protein n=1 Tax=Microbotryum silenes-dioicae TaxID=796604 RepID=A0A2X0N014_9BASI|nr:BQ5605_C006g04040 [Microbotryum silenes-dioicae]
MSLLSDLVHLRTIEVSPLQCTAPEFRQRYVYSGPLLRNSPVSALDDVVDKCSLGQLVRSSINFSMDLLELFGAHHVEGYSRRNPLAEELSLQALLWSCDPHCNACSNGIRIKTC